MWAPGNLFLRVENRQLRRGKVDKQVGVIGLVFAAYFVRHAPITHSREGSYNLLDFFMGSFVFLRIVESQLPLAG